MIEMKWQRLWLKTRSMCDYMIVDIDIWNENENL